MRLLDLIALAIVGYFGWTEWQKYKAGVGPYPSLPTPVPASTGTSGAAASAASLAATAIGGVTANTTNAGTTGQQTTKTGAQDLVGLAPGSAATVVQLPTNGSGQYSLPKTTKTTGLVRLPSGQYTMIAPPIVGGGGTGMAYEQVVGTTGL